jgi:WD40-like Beta Propeller Repeat
MPGNRRIQRSAAIAVVVGSLVSGASLAAAGAGLTERVSVATNGTQGNNISGRFAGPAINANGQVVAFDSIATSLAGRDTNMEADVFVHDRTTATTKRVSVSSTGQQANESSSRPALDAAGDTVVFDSFASNLVPGDTNQALDVFAHDLTTGATTRVSLRSNEAQGNAQSHTPSISSNGRFVAFVSTASNLVPGDTNNAEDIFVRDLVAGTTELVSVRTNGTQGNSSTTATSISASGRWVAFSSFATNLVSGDTNGLFDVFLHDRTNGVTTRVSVSSDEEQGNADSSTPSVSRQGHVAFMSGATNLVPNDTNEAVDIFVRDRIAGTTERVSVNSDEEQANDDSQHPAVRGFTASGPDITPNARFVTFYAIATNLVPGDTNTCPQVFEEPGTCPDVFVRDRVAGTTERWSVASDGTQANDRSADPVVSNDGTTVAFFSAASNLVAGDTNTCPPIFLDFPGQCPDIFVHQE